jgi:hypothetical protein
METVETTTQAPVRTWDDLSHAEREELKTLSKEVYGASSRAKKLIDQGYAELLTEETTEYVPGKTEGEEGTTRTVKIPLKRKDGAKQSVITRHTVDSIKAEMLDRKAKLDEIRAIIKKQQDEAKEKKAKDQLAQHVHERLAGSAT